jgi:predicted flap endonuclease-1-like 5' DNA nuclease
VERLVQSILPGCRVASGTVGKRIIGASGDERPGGGKGTIVKIDEIEGIGPAYRAKLAEAGVSTAEELLRWGADQAGRTSLEKTTGISGKLILEWVNHVDLMRINGVGSEYSDLLEAAGVDSPSELAQRNASNLAVTLQEVVAARPGIVRRTPSESEVQGWIDQAKTMSKVVEH